MIVAVGCDHGGFPLKDAITLIIRNTGHEVLDLGTNSSTSVDYPDFVEKVGKTIQTGDAQRGVLLCGSGVGACIAANKMKGIYAGLCHDTYSAHQGVEHDDMNVLCLGARVIGEGTCQGNVKSFLTARFIGNDSGEERHARRVGKIRKLENRT